MTSIKKKVRLNRHQCIPLHLHPAWQISLHFHTQQKIGSASARLRFLIFFANHASREVHPDVLFHLLCQHIHLPPLDENLLVVRDAIINLPVVDANHTSRQVHPDVLLHLLSQHIHLPPLDQNLLVVRDTIINLPVVEVKRRRDGGG
jgi:hypothetical protein